MVITVVLAMLVIGLSEWGWLIALLVPVLALTGYIVLNTIRVMIADSKE